VYAIAKHKEGKLLIKMKTLGLKTPPTERGERKTKKTFRDEE